MSHLEQLRTLPTVACAHALHEGCPYARQARSASVHPRSQWLRLTCAFACRCTARFRALFVLAGWAGIAGFCAASVGFFIGALNELMYLAGVAGSMSLFTASVFITRLGDPYELKRMECQRKLALQTLAVRPVARVAASSVARPPRAAMN